MTKGIGQTTKTAVLILNAIEKAKRFPSRAADVKTNEFRNVMYVVTKAVNSNTSLKEFPLVVCIATNIGSKQYNNSFHTIYIFVTQALSSFMRLVYNIKVNRCVEIDDDGEDDIADDVIEVVVEGGGDIVMDMNGNPILVLQNMDYLYRGPELKFYCLLDYQCCIEKFIVPEGGFKEIDDDEEDDEELDGAGRKKNGMFNFDSSHPQYGAYAQRLRSKLLVPFICGEKVPKMPKTINQAWQYGIKAITNIVDQQILNYFGAYFMVLCCPYDYKGNKYNFIFIRI
jgi:hypothetical protein